MYEDDTPRAERRAQVLSLDRDLLKELLGQEELRDLIDPGALEEVEEQLRGSPRNPDQLHDVLRLRGDLRPGQYDSALAEPLLAERRAITVRVGGEERLVAAEDAGRYRDALGAMPPGGLPEVFLEGGKESLESLVARFAKGRGPFTTAEANEHFGVDVEPVLRELEREERLVRGELRPGGTEREWCDPDVLRRLRRASLAALRKEVEPAEQAALGRFLPSWHGIDRRASLREALVPLQALPLPVALWESDVLPRRVPGYQPASLDQLCATGELVWVGAGLDRVAVYFREDASALGRVAAAESPEGDVQDRIRAVLGSGAEFWFDLLAAAGARGGGGTAGFVGPRLGRRGDERRLDAASGGSPLRRAPARAPSAAFLAPALDRDHCDPGTLVAHGQALPGDSGPARARRAPSRAPGNRHARRCPRRGHSGWLQRGLWRAEGARDARPQPGGVTSSRGSAGRSSRSAARSNGCGSSVRRRARRPRRS